MSFGILGSGLMGGKLGTLFAHAGHEVVFSYARQRKKLEELANTAEKTAWKSTAVAVAVAHTLMPVLGTLVIQGLTLKPLLRALDLHDDDPVGREVSAARERALRAGLASFSHDQSPVAQAVRQKFTAHLTVDRDTNDTKSFVLSEHGRLALQSARQAIFTMRANDEIGDDAFHRIEGIGLARNGKWQ